MSRRGRDAGRRAESVAALRRAVRLQPGHAAAWSQLGLMLHGRGELREALRCFRTAATLRGDADDHHHVAAVRYSLGDLDAARSAAQQAIVQRGDQPRFHRTLAMILHGQGDLTGAAASCERALAQDRQYPNAWHTRGVIEQSRGRLDEARRCFERALERAPAHAGALSGLAELCDWQGRWADGLAHLAPLMTQRPPPVDAVGVWARLQRHAGRAREVVAPLREALGRVPPGSGLARQMHFTLGDVLADTGAHAQAFEHYRRGNALKRASFDRAAHGRFVDRMVEAFPAAPARSGRVAAMPEPVFIVGMPRSGTSLVESILAAHPQVHGAGERPEIGRLAARLGCGSPSGAQAVAELDEAAWTALADQYLADLAPRAGALYVTDKMPLNFLYLGLIARLFPAARIVHCVREPRDVGLSCFFQDFVDPALAFSFELGDIGAFLCQYRRLMRHWRSVSALESLEVNYETFVRDAERGTRELLDFCGLSWEPACLQFHTQPRNLNTASHAQVREAVHTRAVGRSRNYAPWLEPLCTALENCKG